MTNKTTKNKHSAKIGTKNISDTPKQQFVVMPNRTESDSEPQIFDDTFVFPDGTTEIDCSDYSVFDLSSFNGRIPNTVTKIILKDKTLDTIGKDIELFAKALAFQQRYPAIVITGKTKTFDKIIKERSAPIKIDENLLETTMAELGFHPELESELKTPSEPAAKKIKKETKKTEQLPVKPSYPVKTEDFCTREEVFAICIETPDIAAFNNDDVALEREVQKQMLKFEKYLCTKPNTHVTVCCIKRSKVPELIENLKTELQRKLEIRKMKNIVQKTPAEQEIKKIEPKKTSQENTTVVSENIKKYIPKNLWSEICKACGKSTTMQNIVLETIASVNIDPNETPDSSRLQVIDPITNIRTTSSYMKRENPNCVVQSVSDCLYNDNKRIIWAYLPDEKALVCVGILAEHTKTKSSKKYSKLRQLASIGKNAKGELITLQKIIDKQYFDVEVLLKEGVQDLQKTLKPDYVKPIVTVTEHVKPDYIKPVITVTEKPKDLSDVIALQKNVESVIELIDKTIKDTVHVIANEQNATKQLEQLDLIREVLKKKEKLQNALPEVADLKIVLEKIKQNIK